MDEEKTVLAEQEFMQNIENEKFLPPPKEQKELAIAFFVTEILSVLIFYVVGAFGQTSINVNADINVAQSTVIPVLIYGAVLFAKAKNKQEWQDGVCLVYAALSFIFSIYAMAAGIVSRGI